MVVPKRYCRKRRKYTLIPLCPFAPLPPCTNVRVRAQAIWAVQNGLGTFFGSQTGGRLGKKEVTQGPHSRAERQKRKKKKKKKKKGR